MKRIKIDDIDNKNPFEVPEGYFSQLNQDILDKIAETDVETTLIKTRNNYWYWVAASLLIALVSISLLINQNNSTEEPQYLSNISNEEIIYYLEYYEMDEFDLMESVTGEMEWIPVEEDLLQDLEINDNEMNDIYIEFGITEISES